MKNGKPKQRLQFHQLPRHTQRVWIAAKRRLLAAMTVLKLGLIMPLSDGSTSFGVAFYQLACAAMLAAYHVNNGVETIVPGLQALTAGISVSPILLDNEDSLRGALVAYRQGIRDGAHGIVGSDRSSVSTILATLGSIDDVPQCSYWASSPSLSAKELYPLFSRTYPSDAATTVALPRVIQELGWSTIGIIHADDDYANAYAGELVASAAVSVAVTATFQDGVWSTMDPALKLLKDSQVNIIVAIVFDGDAYELLRRAREIGIYADGYAWITTDATVLAEAVAVSADPVEARLLFDGLLNFRGSASVRCGRNAIGAPRQLV